MWWSTASFFPYRLHCHSIVGCESPFAVWVCPVSFLEANKLQTLILHPKPNVKFYENTTIGQASSY